MWEKIKSFMKARRTPKELGLIAKGVFDVFCNNKKKILLCVLFFVVLNVFMTYISMNFITHDAVTGKLTKSGEQISFVVGMLFMISCLFVPTLIYTILKKAHSHWLTSLKIMSVSLQS